MDIEGKLHFRVDWNREGITGVTIESTRPFPANRLLAGMEPKRAIQLVPQLYSVCGKAQGVAAARAYEAALGIEPVPSEMLAQELLVILETVQEYLWRFLMDWPAALDLPASPEKFAGWYKHLNDAGSGIDMSGNRQPTGSLRKKLAEKLTSYVEREMLGIPLQEWLQIKTDGDLEAWCTEGKTCTGQIISTLRQRADWGRSPVKLMTQAGGARAPEAALPALMSDEAFASRPHLLGEPLETGALARLQDHLVIGEMLANHGNTVAVKVIARLMELVEVVEHMEHVPGSAAASPRVRGSQVKPGAGLGLVETARGMLMHLMEIENERVNRYRVVAPTEWNFHPQGAFAKGLQGVAAAEENGVAQRVKWMALALDPCVAYEMEISGA